MARPKRVRRSPTSQTTQGLPGYRTRDKRSGLDPIDTNLEFAYLRGRFLRRLFTGRVRTRNPFYLIGMTFIGLCLSSPLVLLALSAFATSPAGKTTGSLLNNFGMLCTMGILVMISVVGVAFLANVVVNLFTWKR